MRERLDMVFRTSDRVDVVRCMYCEHCFELAATDPLTPYKGGKDGFYCEAFDMDFYAPKYNAATYYCADGKRRPTSECICKSCVPVADTGAGNSSMTNIAGWSLRTRL